MTRGGRSALFAAGLALALAGLCLLGRKAWPATLGDSLICSTATLFGNAFSVGGSTFVVNGGLVGIGTASPARPLDVVGGMKSTLWNITQALNQASGAMPVTSAAFSTHGGTLLLFASGSGYSSTAGAVIGMNIQVDGVNQGVAKSYTNESLSHKVFTANALVVAGIAAGSHTVGVTALTGTSSDTNDFFSITVYELPY